MSANLAGLHDRESVAIAPSGTWAVDTVALSENPLPIAYPANLNWIARLNHGYGSTGTLPLPERYASFAQRVAAYVSGSSGCRRWIIGNEPNLSREWPSNQPIFPWRYADCFKLCRQAIHALPGHAQDEVLLAASGPWNAELKYASNPNGDWIIFFRQIIDLLDGEFEGAALHAYTHGYDPALVTSTARMEAPFQSRYYNFRTYQDYMAELPPGKTAYITEANGNGPWQAVGLMPAMLVEIDGWNHAHPSISISCVAFYRYPRYDDYHIEGRQDVIAEYHAAAAKGYMSPTQGKIANLNPAPQSIPVPASAPAPAPVQREIDPRLIARGVHFDFVSPPAGTGYWRIKAARWLNEQEADKVGPDHHILGTVTRGDAKVAGVSFLVRWPNDSTHIVSKNDSGAAYNYDYPMSPSLNEFAIEVADAGNPKAPTDKAAGIGMGAGGNPAIHTSTWIDWEWAIAGDVSQPQPPIYPLPNPPQTGGLPLLWPVAGLITQRFGENPKNYAQFGQAGHTGIDIGVTQGTAVQVITAGEVMYTGFDPDYGNYVRVWHENLHSHSFYAHLSDILCAVGQKVAQGDVIAKSGSTGNSTGPHLHLELRGGMRDSYYDVTFGYTQGRYDPVVAYLLTGSSLAPSGSG